MWMPTFDAAGMPTFVNPMQMVTMAWNQGLEDEQMSQKTPAGEKTADRDVRRLGSFFNIDPATLDRLDELLDRRKDSRERDLAKLYEVLETARSPSRLLTAKLEEMEDGQFVTNFKRDENIDRLCQQHGLNEAARCRLVELRVRRKETQEQDHARLEEHLELCADPSFTAISLVKKVTQGRLTELPDLGKAKALAQGRLDQAASRKLRDVVEKRAISDDLDVVLAQIKQVLDVAFNASVSFMKVVDTFLAGGLLDANAIEVIRLESKQQSRAVERQKKAQKKKEKLEKKQKKAKKSSSSSDSSSSGSSESSESSGKKKKKKKAKKVKKKGKTKKGKKDKKAK